MTAILESIRHYQRSINRSLEDETRLLHCLNKLNRLPIKMKYLQETRFGRTVNNLRKRDGIVGHAATTLVAKWKREVDSENAGSSDKDKRLHTDDTKNIKSGTRNNDTKESRENGTSSNSDSLDQMINRSLPVSRSTGNSPSKCREKFSQSRKKFSESSDKKISESHQCSSSISRSTSKRGSDNLALWSNCYRVEAKNSKRRSDGEIKNDKKRRREIDSKMVTSFAEVLGMLDVQLSSKKLHKHKSSLSEASTSNKYKNSSKRSSGFDGTPILLKERPQLEPPALEIAAEILSSSTITDPECTFRQPKKPQPKTNQLPDDVTINITSRTSKTKVFSGNKAGLKCEVPTLFAMCIHILQDNIDLLDFIGGVPFDILRPVLERTTCDQLMILEDHNPYLMEDTHCLWEQHCKRRFRTKIREELETWRDMYIRCLDEEQAKFISLTAKIKLLKERQTKPAYDVDTNSKATKNTKANQMKSSGRGTAAAAVSHGTGNSGSQNATKPKDSNKIQKRSNKSNDDPDWTPTTWYKTLYKKPRDPKPPKPPIKKTIDMLRYDRAKALEKKKEEWEKRPR